MKSKAKYNPIPDVLVPSGPIIILCASTLAKMKKGAYCELWYFSNRDLKAAETSTTYQEHLDYVTVRQGTDGPRALVVASASDLPISKSCNKKDDAYKVRADEDLSWEDFLKATPQMVVSMQDNDWANDHIQIFIKFWTAIHGHPWCHASDRCSQQVLYTYQAQQWRKWHLATATSHGWSLARINQDVLWETRGVIIADAHQRGLAALNKVYFMSTLALLLLREPLLTSHFSFTCTHASQTPWVYFILFPTLAPCTYHNHVDLAKIPPRQSCPLGNHALIPRSKGHSSP